MKRRIISLIVLIVSLILSFPHHLGTSLGDDFVRLLGLNPWSGSGDTGLHFTVLFTFLLFMYGMIGVVMGYRDKYPSVFLFVIVGCVVFALTYPLATEKLMFIVKHNATGETSLDYSSKESTCSFRTNNGLVEVSCSLTIFNYGKEVLLKIKPQFSDIDSFDDNLEFQYIEVTPHKKRTINNIIFTQKIDENHGVNGTKQPIRFQIEVARF